MKKWSRDGETTTYHTVTLEQWYGGADAKIYIGCASRHVEIMTAPPCYLSSVTIATDHKN